MIFYFKNLLSKALKRAFKKKFVSPFGLLVFIFIGANSFAAEPNISSENFAIALQKQYQLLNKSLLNNQFNRPLVLNSTETSDKLKGEIYAVLDYPFAKVSTALNNPNNWCNALILHINVKYCRAENNQSGPIIHLNLGKKHDQPLEDTYKASFKYNEVTTSPDYFSIELKAAEGPLGTSDYRIWVEATPLINGRTFLHFTYAYSFGLTGRLAMKGYLATIGKDKVGFTQIDQSADNDNQSVNGEPKFIQGVRGVVERNTMRYYLAIDAFLASLSAPKTTQIEKSLQIWFDNTEVFAQQLHEIDKDQYMTMKLNEIKRQKSN